MSIRDQYAHEVIKRHHQKLRGRGAELPTVRLPVSKVGPLTVGIIGAGASGLYAAMIIESFGPNSGITYEILEANDKRIGGRLYTYNFSPSSGPNDYYDIGAMRFPKIPFMDRTFDLFQRLNITSGNKQLIPYVLGIPTNLNFFNGIVLTNAQLDAATSLDPFNTGVNPPDTVDNMINATLGPFKTALVNNFDEGWEALMKYDDYSTRDYMVFGSPGYKDPVINYLETFNSATGLYDQALAESVMDSLDFDYAENVTWHCVQGGLTGVANAMAATLTAGKIHNGKRVTAITPITTPPNTHATSVNVTIHGEISPRNYSHVISTMPLSCLRMVDTSQCGLSWTMQTAMRDLHYDSSVKVAIKFSKRWWETMGQIGGVSSTDRPTRTVVYPSYGIGSTTDASMIVSYTWAQDAWRFGAFTHGKDSNAEQVMIDVILKDLADMHGIKDYTFLPGLMLDYNAYNWYGSEYSAGAFALFGPGQFSNLFPEVTKPPAGLLHFAGEATSVHHAWVVGALNSAYRTIHEILYAEGRKDLITQLKANWGTVDEIDDPLLHQQVALGQRM